MNTSIEELMTLSEAARFIGVTPPYIIRLAKERSFQTVGKLGKSIITTKAIAEAFKADRERRRTR